MHRTWTDGVVLRLWLQSPYGRGRERIEAVADWGGRLAAAPAGRAAGRGRVRGGSAGARPRLLGGGGAVHPGPRAGAPARRRRRARAPRAPRAPQLRPRRNPARRRLGRLPLPDPRRPARPRPGGAISFSQQAGDRPELRSTITGFQPRLGRQAGARRAGPGRSTRTCRPGSTARSAAATSPGSSGAGCEGRRLRRERGQSAALCCRLCRPSTTSSPCPGGPRSPEPGLTWAVADVTRRRRRSRRCSPGRTSSTTSCTRSAQPTSRSATRAAAEVAREAEEAGVRQIVYLGGLGDDAPDLSRAPAEPARDRRAARRRSRARHRAAGRDGRRKGQRRLRDDRRARRPAPRDDHAPVGLDADPADRARRRRALPRGRGRPGGGVRRDASTSAGRR